jgi:YopX protein
LDSEGWSLRRKNKKPMTKELKLRREIKFRVWNGAMWMNTDEIELGSIKVAQRHGYIFQQFTGLCDKNGREIYEGDIVHHGKNAISPVEFHDGSFTLASTSIMHRRSDEIKVIGNIYENPSLLK